MEGWEPIFGAVPIRAIRDNRLRVSDFAMLIAVSSHDRFSILAGGEGCWASTTTLSAECGYHRSTGYESISKLLVFSYLKIEPHPYRRKLRVLRVDYDISEWPHYLGKATPSTETISKQSSSPQLPSPHSRGAQAKVFENIPELSREYISEQNIDLNKKVHAESGSAGKPKSTRYQTLLDTLAVIEQGLAGGGSLGRGDIRVLEAILQEGSAGAKAHQCAKDLLLPYLSGRRPLPR